MKLKTKAVVGIALVQCAVLAMLIRLHMYNLMEVKPATAAPTQKHVRGHSVPSFLYVDNSSAHLRSRECTPTTVMLPSADFTSDGIMDNIEYTVSEQGLYNVVLSSEKRALVERNMGGRNEDKMLRVIVVPHSQNGPSEVLPFDESYQQASRHILDRVVRKLTQYRDISFVWTETSLLSQWWYEQNDTTRGQIKNLITKGQLEIVNGGWIVPDEACTQYHAVIQQMIEGHRWLFNILGVKPRVNWAVNPFGHSQTMSYLWKLAGFDFMVVGRVHEAVRDYLRQLGHLAFSWRQMWDPRGDTDIITHILPFTSSATKDSCGPDSSVCSRFDFLKSPPISEVLREDDPDFVVMASALYEQYRLSARASSSKLIFIPIGGENRWATDSEWDNNYRSYQKLFKYMNSRSDWNVFVRFGTMTDYFNSLERAQKDANPNMALGSSFPVFSGDFLPYSERDNTYWTGFYSSRPWIKFLCREVDTALRTADILHVMACIRSPFDIGLQKSCRHFAQELRAARQSLALFHSTGAITGTSRPDVVDDYNKKLLQAMRGTQVVANWAVPALLLTDLTQTVNVFPAARLPYGMTLKWPPTAAVRISQTRSVNVVFFNPLPRDRLETVTIRVNDSAVAVSHGTTDIDVQILPVVSVDNVVNSTAFDAMFTVRVPALGMETVRLYRNNTSSSRTRLSDILIKKSANTFPDSFDFRPESLSSFREIVLENNCLKLEFEGRTGLLKEVLDKISGRRTTVDMDFVKYTPYKGSSRVFQARLEAESFTDSDKVNVLVNRGGTLSSVQVLHSIFQHTIRLYDTKGALCRAIYIENISKLKEKQDFELVMRIRTDIKNFGTVYTDSNNLQMIRRVRRSKLPLGANLFPMTSMAFIQSRARRLTLHSFQSLAVSSPRDGFFDVLLDRTLEGLNATNPSPSKFYMVLEEAGENVHDHGQYTLPTLLNHQLNDLLQSPVLALQYPHASSVYFRSRRRGLARNFPCDLHLVSLREMTIDTKDIFGASLILHRRGHRCGLPPGPVNCLQSKNSFTFEATFPHFRMKKVDEWTLSYLDKVRNVSLNDVVKMSPMDIKAFHMRWLQ